MKASSPWCDQSWKLTFGTTSDCSGQKHIHHLFKITFEIAFGKQQFCLLWTTLFPSHPSSPCMEWNTSKIPLLPISHANVLCVPSFQCPHAEASGQKPKHLFLFSTSTTHNMSPLNYIMLITVRPFFLHSHITIAHFVIFSFHMVHLHHSFPWLLAFWLCTTLTYTWLLLYEIMNWSMSCAHLAFNGILHYHSPQSFFSKLSTLISNTI